MHHHNAHARHGVAPAPWVKPKTRRPAAGLATSPVIAGAGASGHHSTKAHTGVHAAQATDQLVAQALHLAFARPFTGVPQLTPARVLQLGAAVLASDARKSSLTVAQHFNARLVAYGRHLLPRDHWYITTADPAAGILLWRHDDPRMPDVLDVLTTGVGRNLAVSLQLHAAAAHVVRTCDLANPRASVLQFPGEARTYPWCTADDPLRYGLAALTVPAVSSHTGSHPTADTFPGPAFGVPA